MQGEHVLGGPHPVDRRHAKIRIFLGVLRHFRDRRRLEAQIHLDRHAARQRIHHFDDAQPPRLRGHPLGVEGDECERLEIGLEAALDARPQHLDGDWPALALLEHLGAMHLRDRGGRNGRAEARETVAQRRAERAGDGGLGLGLRKRCHSVLQAFEIARQRRADDIRPRCQKLSELDVARAEPGQRRGEPHRAGCARRPRRRGRSGPPFDEPAETQHETDRPREEHRIQQAEYPLAREHEAGAGEPRQMRGSQHHGGTPHGRFRRAAAVQEIHMRARRDHSLQPEWSATMPPDMRRCDTRRKPAPCSIAASVSGCGNRRIDSTR